MLRFYSAGESRGQALLTFLSGLPAGLRVDLAFVNRRLLRRPCGLAHVCSGMRWPARFHSQ
ncbi:MAG: chorismate synthase [Candidatus Acidiferrum sp.]